MTAPPEFSRWRPHPWHGIDCGVAPPTRLRAYIEITPFDLVKYELDKQTGMLRVDRPQRTSSLPPTLYGLVPRTLCSDRVARLMPGAVRGDEDPLDICVLSERPITRAEVLLDVRVVGGLPMLDGGEADDKIIAVLENDPVWGAVNDMTDLPEPLIGRLRHYFSTYKTMPGEDPQAVIGPPYHRAHAESVVTAAMEDYRDLYGEAAPSFTLSPPGRGAG